MRASGYLALEATGHSPIIAAALRFVEPAITLKTGQL